MKKTQPPSGLMNFLLEKNRFGIDFMINQATKSVKEKTGGKYPAPFAILKVIKEGLSKGPAAGYAMEAVEFGKLGMSNESKSLVSIFFADTAAKKNRFGKPKNTYNNLAVIGAGLMGAGIAQVYFPFFFFFFFFFFFSFFFFFFFFLIKKKKKK